jgi:hypothetical protein
MSYVTRPSKRGRALFCAVILSLALGAERDVRAEDERSADNAYLDALQGDWDMTGTFLGKPVKYRVRGERVLQGGFLRLHMIDAAEPPAYDADLFFSSLLEGIRTLSGEKIQWIGGA